MTSTDRHDHKWYQLSLRTLFVVMTVACAGAVWVAYERAKGDEQEVREWLNSIPHVEVWGVSKWESPEERRRAREFDFDAWVSQGRQIHNIEGVLRTMLENRDSSVDLSRVAFALSEVGTTDSVPLLITCLDSPDPSLQFMAVESLGRIGDSRAVDPLGTRLMLIAERDENVVTSIVSALGNIGGEAALEYLSRAARGEDALVSRIADEQVSRTQSDSNESVTGTAP